jgi:hypothetical protein
VAALPGSRAIGEVVVDVEERSAGDVPLEVRAAAVLGVGEVPAAVDELVAQGRESSPESVGITVRPSA